MKTYFIMGARNLWQARRRTALLGMALALVSLLLILLMSLSQGFTDTLIRSATLLASGHVNVGGFYKAKPDDAFPMLTDVSSVRKLVREKLPGVERIIDRRRGWAKIVSDTGSISVGITGINIDEERQLLERLQLAKESEYVDGGRDIVVGSAEDLTQEDTALVFAGQAKRLHVQVGDVLTVSTQTMNGQTNTVDVRIVGVAKDLGFMSNWRLFVPKKTVATLYGLNENTSGIVMVYLEDIESSDAAMAQLNDIFAEAGYDLMEHQGDPFWAKFEIVAGEDWTGQKIDLTTWEDETSYMQWTLSALDSISFFMISVLLLIIAVGIMNAMWIAVRERTNEIGTLRAIGMRRRQVLGMFMTEMAMLGFISSAIGSGVGVLLALVVEAAQIPIPMDAMRAILLTDVLHLSISPDKVAAVVAAFTFVTMLAAFWPASRAAQMAPVTAIHRVG